MLEHQGGVPGLIHLNISGFGTGVVEIIESGPSLPVFLDKRALGRHYSRTVDCSKLHVSTVQLH